MKGTKTSTAMSTRAGMWPRTEAGTRTIVEMRGEGRESLGTYQVVIVVIVVIEVLGWEHARGGATPTSNQ